MLDKRNQEYRDLERTLNAEIVDRDRAIIALQAKVEELQKQPEQAQDFDLKSVLTEDEIALLEDEGLSPAAQKLVAKLSRHVASKEAKPLEKKVETVEQVAQANASANFFARLGSPNGGHPDWEQVNADPRWHSWLNERMPGANYTRQAIINDAQKRLDPSNIIMLISDFKQLSGWGKPVKSKLEEQVETIKPSNTAPPVDTGKGKIWSSQEIKEFYSKAAATKMAIKNPDEFNRIDQEIQRSAGFGRTQR